MRNGSRGFPRRVRLTGAADYQRVFSQRNRRLGNRWLTMLVIPNDSGEARLGLAISRRIASRAVARNRIKRIVRESFRGWRAQLPACDVVVMGRHNVAGLSSRQLHAAIEDLWEELMKQCAGSSSI